MQITIHGQDQGITRIGVKGAITQKKVSQAEKLLPDLLGKDVYRQKVLFSMQESDFIDSSGINWLLICHKRFAADGGRLVLHSIPELADKVLRILRLENVFEIAADETQARQLVQQPRQPKPVAESTATDDATEPQEDAAEA
jgi:anti-anti-sigma factor